ncbi:hypothetical protein KKA39_01955, partial [Patescibacteria group bacterium]|nr:hypothetical protein [Patescibacteria group bacterium]
SVAFASWWNPFSWFHNWNFLKKNQEIQILETLPGEIEKKLDDASASTQTQNIIDLQTEESKIPTNTNTSVQVEAKPIKPVVVASDTLPPSEINKYDSFVTCLKNKGAVFYGASWCSHCNTQKLLFGASKDLLPYTECSVPDSREQAKACKDNGIMAYPTWKFADGSRLVGEASFEELAQKTSCRLP